MEIKNIGLELEEIGLTKSEIKVYLSLLKLGPSTTGPIINESKTSNSKIYIVLDKLIDKGLVTFFTDNNLKHFRAVEPTHLLKYLKEKQEEIKRNEGKIRSIIPVLMSIAKTEDENEALVFKGAKAIKTAFNDVVDSLNKGDEVHIMGIYDFKEEFLKLGLNFHNNRSKKGINARVLINNKAKRIAKLFSQFKPIKIRLMKKEIQTPAVFLIYKNKVIISLGDEMVFFMIKSESSAKAFNIYFEEMWKNSREYN
ncbi:MAG: helix-turn-helix domain-containing protein [Candidatus Nanoarchaeia archaeon]|nr:helix-turn-helix domain-containing protein [Candidatus Nanoarchaeia archaeon]